MPEIVNDPDGTLEGKFNQPEQPVTYTQEQVAQMLAAQETNLRAELAQPVTQPAPEPEKPAFDAEAAFKGLQDQVRVMAARPAGSPNVPEVKAAYDPSREIGQAFTAGMTAEQKAQAIDEYMKANSTKTMAELGLVTTANY